MKISELPFEEDWLIDMKNLNRYVTDYELSRAFEDLVAAGERLGPAVKLLTEAVHERDQTSLRKMIDRAHEIQWEENSL